MEQKIIETVIEQLSGLSGITINTINQDSPRIGHLLIIGFKGTETELVCRWHKQGRRFDCWYRREKGGKYKIRPYNTNTLYRVHGIESANKLCQMIKIGQEINCKF